MLQYQTSPGDAEKILHFLGATGTRKLRISARCFRENLETYIYKYKVMSLFKFCCDSLLILKAYYTFYKKNTCTHITKNAMPMPLHTIPPGAYRSTDQLLMGLEEVINGLQVHWRYPTCARLSLSATVEHGTCLLFTAPYEWMTWLCRCSGATHSQTEFKKNKILREEDPCNLDKRAGQFEGDEQW